MLPQWWVSMGLVHLCNYILICTSILGKCVLKKCDLTRPLVSGLDFSPYNCSVCVFLNLRLKHSDPWSYVVYICQGYLINHVVFVIFLLLPIYYLHYFKPLQDRIDHCNGFQCYMSFSLSTYFLVPASSTPNILNGR